MTKKKTKKKSSAASELGRRGGKKGGKARAEKMTPEERSEVARSASVARWGYKISEGDVEIVDVDGPPDAAVLPPSPFAKHRGALNLGGTEIDVYVLDTGARVISQAASVQALAQARGGNLSLYLKNKALAPYLDMADVEAETISFAIPGGEGLAAKNGGRGITAKMFIKICQAYSRALVDGSTDLTDRQRDIALRCVVFVSACAQVGLDALIDEATGYQYERAEDALQIKLRAYIAEELRAWEKTFPDDLWEEFGRLTGWSDSLRRRPRWWGKLVMELIYDALDQDIANHLRNNKPPPRKGQNYHQWLTADIGLQKLHAQIHQVIGIAKTCSTMRELRDRVGHHYRSKPIQGQLPLDGGGEVRRFSSPF